MKNTIYDVKILAENMLRFGTKNLTEDVKKLKLLIEQVTIDLSDIKVSPEDAENVDNEYYQYLLQYFKDNGVIFSISQSDAALYYAVNASTADMGRFFKFQGGTVIKLMDSPNNPEKVLTQGIVTPFNITDPQDTSAESDYLDIVRFCNNSALAAIRDYGSEGGGIIVRVNSQTGLTTFPEANNDMLYVYGTMVTQAAQSRQNVNTTVFTIPAVGRTIEKKIPGSMFATGKVTLADATEVDKAVAELSSLSQDKNIKITGITIQSSASGDRGVGGKSGYPSEADVAANKYPLGKPYRPKSASESGNAALAFGRAETIKAKLGNLAPITIDAVIQNGLDEAQYANIIVTVEKIDKPAQSLSKQDLENILLKPKSTQNLQGTKQIKQFYHRSK
jgi:hypothetical protein